MAQTPRAMVDGVFLSAVSTAYYTVLGNTTAIIKKATFNNNYAGTVTVTINVVPSGDVASDQNELVHAKALVSNETWSCPDIENHVLGTGSAIYMYASAPSVVSVRISGYEVV